MNYEWEDQEGSTSITTKIILTNENGSYSIEVKKYEMTIDEVFEDLFKPILLAAGYHPNSINDYFGE